MHSRHFFFVFQDNGDTVLHIACRRRDLDLVKMLLDSGISVDAKNVRCQYFTPENDSMIFCVCLANGYIFSS